MALGAAREVAGETGPPIWFPAALDAGYLNEKGIETVMFGPGDLAFAHTDAEVVPLEQVRRAARVYAAAALQMLASKRPRPETVTIIFSQPCCDQPERKRDPPDVPRHRKGPFCRCGKDAGRRAYFFIHPLLLYQARALS